MRLASSHKCARLSLVHAFGRSFGREPDWTTRFYKKNPPQRKFYSKTYWPGKEIIQGSQFAKITGSRRRSLRKSVKWDLRVPREGPWGPQGAPQGPRLGRSSWGSVRFGFGSVRFGFGSVRARFGSVPVRFGSGSVRVRFGSVRVRFGSVRARFD